MRFLKLLVLVVFFLLTIPAEVGAIEDPLDRPNNKFGIHIIDPVDLSDASELVNSSGGDWGYVTLVIREDERDLYRWQDIFWEMGRKHLIPIVRVATVANGHNWETPEIERIDEWISFFELLDWPTRNRYIIVGNEPNHASEWGGDIDPTGYSDYLIEFSKKLKSVNKDYFILPAALDASAPNSPSSMDEELFIRKMIEKNPEVYKHIDGWNSHSYPNPAFSGETSDHGRGTIRGYEWEIYYLQSIGVDRDFAIFITETGWAHDASGEYPGNKTIEEVSENYENAFLEVWSDEKIAAITPFILSYPNTPFDMFSWKAKSGDYYEVYSSVMGLEKEVGEPEISGSLAIETDGPGTVMCENPLSM